MAIGTMKIYRYDTAQNVRGSAITVHCFNFPPLRAARGMALHCKKNVTFAADPTGRVSQPNQT
jgi:hypothetical protein